MDWKSFKNNPPKKKRHDLVTAEGIDYYRWGDYIFDIRVKTEDTYFRITAPVRYSAIAKNWVVPGDKWQDQSFHEALDKDCEILYWDYFPYPPQEK